MEKLPQSIICYLSCQSVVGRNDSKSFNHLLNDSFNKSARIIGLGVKVKMKEHKNQIIPSSQIS